MPGILYSSGTSAMASSKVNTLLFFTTKGASDVLRCATNDVFVYPGMLTRSQGLYFFPST